MSVVIFDAYGTLFDLNEYDRTARTVLTDPDDAMTLTQAWRKLHLEFAWQSALMERYQDFDVLAARSIDVVLSQSALSKETAKALRDALLAASKRLPIYDDVMPTLNRLNAKTAIFSNGTLHTMQQLTDRAGILFSFDYILSVDKVQTYKPSRKAYAFAMNRLNAEKADITFVSSNSWDIAGAKSFGFRTCWCNRDHRAFDGLPFRPDVVIHDMQDLVAFI